MTSFSNRRKLRLTVGIIVSAVTALLSATAFAQPMFMGRYSEATGEALYKGVCQGCHMPDAKGASGAGTYPALAGDRRLSSAPYAILVVLKGQKAMPAFGPNLSDEQVAGVVNYIRSNFGNRFGDTVTPAMVKALRP